MGGGVPGTVRMGEGVGRGVGVGGVGVGVGVGAAKREDGPERSFVPKGVKARTGVATRRRIANVRQIRASNLRRSIAKFLFV